MAIVNYQYSEIKRLYLSGEKIAVIAKYLKVAVNTVRRAIKKLNLPDRYVKSVK